MAVFAVFNYDITNPAQYAKYNPGALPVIGATIAKHGGDIIFAGPAEYAAGDVQRHAHVCLKFPTMDAFHAWENDPEYSAIKGDRIEASDNYQVYFVQGE